MKKRAENCGAGTLDIVYNLCLSKALVQDLNPVTIRISNEGNVLHGSVGQTLDPLDLVAKALEALAGLLDVVDNDGRVAESAAGVAVTAGVAGELGVGLGAPVAIDL